MATISYIPSTDDGWGKTVEININEYLDYIFKHFQVGVEREFNQGFLDDATQIFLKTLNILDFKLESVKVHFSVQELRNYLTELSKLASIEECQP